MPRERAPTRGPRRVLDGIGVSPGIVIGKAHVLSTGPVAVEHREVAEGEVTREVRRFRKAMREAKEGLGSVRDGVESEELRKHLFIIDTHMMILEDRMISEDTVRLIRSERINAESAFVEARTGPSGSFSRFSACLMTSR